MRVIVAGSDSVKINKIAITTFLDGLYATHKDKLCVIFYGSGYISSIVEEWIHQTWPGPSAKNCFNLCWVIDHWTVDEEIEACGYNILKEAKPDLIFLFGYDAHELHRPARQEEVPVFLVEKL